MKHVAVYANQRMSDYLIAAIKTRQHIPFEERHDYRLATASANEIPKNRCGQWRLSFLSLWNEQPDYFLATRLSWAIRTCYCGFEQRYFFGYGS
jgi:hypothetical protein